MSDARERLEAAARANNKAQDRATETRVTLRAAILDALAAGVRQADIVRITGYTRERIRQIARAGE